MTLLFYWQINKVDYFWQEISDASLSEHLNIQVYQTNFQGAKLKALDGNFPLTKKLLGEAFFKAISKHFINNVNSVNDSLNFYGEEFPDFLKEIIPYNPNLINRGYLIDAAKLDWAVVQCYFAIDDDLNINWQMRHQNENAYLVLGSHVHLVMFQHIDLTKLKSISFEDLDTGISGNDLIKDLDAKLSQTKTISYLVVYRVDFEVHVMQLNKSEHELFLLLQAKKPIFKVEEFLLTLYTPEQISTLISKFKTAGILIGIREPENEEF
jgi:hypothetical protein